MKKQNKFTFHILILFITLVSSPLLFSYSQKRKPSLIKKPSLSTTIQQQILPQKKEKNDEEELAVAKDENKKTKGISDTAKQIKTVKQTDKTSWTNTYGKLIAPLLLMSLHTALESGIAVFSKQLIKQFMQRKAFKEIKNETLHNIEKEYPEIPQEKKLDLMKISFYENKMDFNKIEKQTSLPYIFRQGLSIAFINTAVLMMGTLVGTTAKIIIQSFLPSE